MTQIKNNPQETYLLERNLSVILWFSFCNSLLFVQSIIILFYETKGMSVTDFFLVQPLFSLAVFFLEIPLSYLSDKKGRKKLVILGSVFSIIGTVILWKAQTFWQMAPCSLAFALGYCLKKNNESSIIYDSLINLNREHDHKKVLGKIRSFHFYGLSIAAITGGIAFSVEPNLPVLLAIAAAIGSLVLSFYIHEPARQKRITEKHPIKDMIDVITHTLHGHADLKWIVLYASFISVASLKGFWVLQPLMNDIGISAIYIGIIGAAYRLISGLSGQLTHKIETLVSAEKLILISIILAIANYTVGTFNLGILIVIPLCFVAISEGFSYIITQDLIQQRTPSDIRATISSVSSMLTRLQFAIVTPIFGWCIDVISIQFAMFSIAGFIFISAGISFIMMKQNKVF